MFRSILYYCYRLTENIDLALELNKTIRNRSDVTTFDKRYIFLFVYPVLVKGHGNSFF